MSDIERIERRLSTVERAVVDGDLELAAVDDAASLTEDLAALTERVDAHERRIGDLEGRIDAFDGLVGSVESVNETVEKRANGAVAAVDRLEYRLDELERVLGSRDTGDSDGVRAAPTTERASRSNVELRHQMAEGNRPIATDRGSEGRRPRHPTRPPMETVGALPPITANEQTDGSLSVEQTATEIVAAPTGEGESPNRQDGPGSDNRADSTATSADSTWSGRQPHRTRSIVGSRTRRTATARPRNRRRTRTTNPEAASLSHFGRSSRDPDRRCRFARDCPHRPRRPGDQERVHR